MVKVRELLVNKTNTLTKQHYSTVYCLFTEKKTVPILWFTTKHIRQCPQECKFNLYEYKYNIKSLEIHVTITSYKRGYQICENERI